jgi:hypothetical protein
MPTILFHSVSDIARYAERRFDQDKLARDLSVAEKAHQTVYCLATDDTVTNLKGLLIQLSKDPSIPVTRTKIYAWYAEHFQGDKN